MSAAASVSRRAGFALFVLTLINLVNYLDRYVIAVAMPRIQEQFGLSGKQGGLLASLFIVVFMVASPLGGFLGDRLPRKLLVGGSVLLWSLATGASGLATSFGMLLVARCVIGVGEAGYGAVAPSIISDLYPRDERTAKLAFFYVAIPVGAGLGYVLGGWLTKAYSWNVAFYAAGVPGLLLALLAFTMWEPRRGAMDGPDAEVKLPFLVGLKGLARNRAFWATTLGYTLMTFSIGGIAVWMPTFLVRERGFAEDNAGLVLGVVTVLAGIVGTLVGGRLGDRLDRRRAGGGLRMSGFGLLGAAPFIYLAAKVQGFWPICAAVFVAQFLLFLNSGPINAAIVNCVPPAFRAFAMGFNVLCIHLLGDALSPTAIGAIADAGSYGLAIELNAVPVLFGGAALLVASRWLGEQLARPPAPFSAPPPPARPAAAG
ncbi:MFS transporter [Aggregicoccus sp. 17bor-14]|uniref:spinster family MFS transporter n=1 Tax=Myxococcaceae TaxID=31 RepID=UPI00129C8CCC|nr:MULTISPECIES: MFS transporter [Myxococcaceae]MBF5044260.1 MFS transporter [Simulacricoccus sp. 17bor-14]MRI90010.1 MFS transporter [Aggregicoccus sp. 17bor-14]